MKVYLLKDVAQVGRAGIIVRVADGFALNFLVPRKLAVVVTPENEASFAAKVTQVVQAKNVAATKTSLLADRIAELTLVLKKKIHDGDRLYGAVTAHEIVDLLGVHGVSVSKSQIEFTKAIKTKGVHEVTIKLSNALKPVCKVKIVPEV